MPDRFDPTLPTVLFPGRFQPFHDGHLALATAILAEHRQVSFGIRAMPPSRDDPYGPLDIWVRIKSRMEKAGFAPDRYGYVILPNLAVVAYGRDVGYGIRHYGLRPEVEAISATAIRKGL